MELPRRRFVQLAAGALPALLSTARAQVWPSRAVNLIVGFAPGGAPDIVARLIGKSLTEQLGQTFTIENLTGAGGNIAAEAVARAAPDGHTFLVVISANAVNAALYDTPNFNFRRDIAPVAGLIRAPNFMLVNPSVPAKSVPEFIAYAKANAGRVYFGSGGIGTLVHLCGELFKMMTGVDMTHVPYRGEALGLTDLIAGHIQVMFPTATGSIEHIKSGTLRALGVTSSMRLQALPDLPTVGESVPTYEVDGWSGLGAPRNTPSDIVDKLNAATNAALADPRIKMRLTELSSVPMPMSAADFGKLMGKETDKWGEVIRALNIKPG